MKMVSKPRDLVLVVVVLALWAASAAAAIIEIGLTAEVTEVDDTGGLLEGQINVGDLIPGSYKYDSDTPDMDWHGAYPPPAVGDYWHWSAPYGIRLNAGGFVFQTDPDDVRFAIEILNDHPGDGYNLMSENNLPIYEDVSVSIIRWQLDDYSGTALSSHALPTTAPVLADWADTWFGLMITGGTIPPRTPGGSSYLIRSSVTSVWLVPEPGTALLLAFGGLAVLRKRRR
jgi:hypothetical protein